MDLFADKRGRPRVEIEPSSLERTMTMMAWLAVAVTVAVVLRYWPELPAEVPQIFNARGEVDAWGPRWMVLVHPALALLLIGSFSGSTSWLKRHPELYNFPWPITEENARRQYALANEMLATFQAVTGWVFPAATWQVCRVALGETAPLGVYFLPVTVGLLLAPIGIYLFRAYRER